MNKNLKEIIQSIATALSNHVMASTRKIEVWDETTFQRAVKWSQWLANVSKLLEGESFVSSDMKCSILDWLNTVSMLQPIFFNLNLEWCTRSKFELLLAILDNPLTSEAVWCLAICEATNSMSLKHSEYFCEWLAESAARQSVLDILVSMNTDIKDLLASHESNIKKNFTDVTSITKSCPERRVHGDGEGDENYEEKFRMSNEFLYEPPCYEMHVIKEACSNAILEHLTIVSQINLGTKNFVAHTSVLNEELLLKELMCIKPWLESHAECLSVFCLILRSRNDLLTKFLVSWLLELCRDLPNLSFNLWHCQLSQLLCQVCSKHPSFFKFYLMHLVQLAKKSKDQIDEEFNHSKNWIKLFCTSSQILDDTKRRLEDLSQSPILNKSVTNYLKKQGLQNLLPSISH